MQFRPITLSVLLLMAVSITSSCGDSASVRPPSDAVADEGEQVDFGVDLSNDDELAPDEDWQPPEDLVSDIEPDETVLDITETADSETEVADSTPDLLDPCEALQCPVEQRCEVQEGGAVCVANSCEELACGTNERCVPTPTGAYCRDISCVSSDDCVPEQFCNGTVCVDDICVSGSRRCLGELLQECNEDGSDWSNFRLCGSSNPNYQSVCIEQGGDAGCSCEDDWDCPEYMFCELGVCRGSAQAPTCLLPPEPFANVLPVPEIVWGGVDADWTAKARVSIDGVVTEIEGAPFAHSG